MTDANGRPQRLQRKRTKGSRLPEGTVVVTRGTDWGNPYRVGDKLRTVVTTNGVTEIRTDYELTITPTVAVELFKAWVIERGWAEQMATELRGRDLACYCRAGEPCHADWILRVANATEMHPPF